MKRLESKVFYDIESARDFESKEYKFYWYITPFIKFNSYSFLFSNNCIKQKGSDLGKRIWHIFICVFEGPC